MKPKPLTIFSLLLVSCAQKSFARNDLAIELNEKIAKLQLTINKQQEKIKQLEADKSELELKVATQCKGQQATTIKPSHYANPLCKT